MSIRHCSFFALTVSALAACAPATAQPDGSIDGSIDAAVDAAQPDRAQDTMTDASADSSAPADGGACSQYEGNPSWTARLVVEPGARLCAVSAREWSSPNPSETQEQMIRRSLREALANKSTITVQAGAYALPTTSESRAFLLPICVRDLDGAAPVTTAASMVTATRVEGGIGQADGFYVSASFGLGSETLDVTVTRPITSATTATLTTAPIALHSDGVFARRPNNRLYTSCALRANRCFNIALAGLGSVRLDEYGWQASPGQGLAVPLRVQGSLDGAALDVRAYESMTAVYGHHAFDRVHLVRLPTAVRGACALRITLGLSEDSATLADCDGVPMGAPLTVTTTMTACQP